MKVPINFHILTPSCTALQQAVQSPLEVVRIGFQRSDGLRATEAHTTQLFHRFDVVINRRRCPSYVLVDYWGQVLGWL